MVYYEGIDWDADTVFNGEVNAGFNDAVRTVKRAIKFTGVKCRREMWGNTIVLFPPKDIGGIAMILIHTK